MTMDVTLPVVAGTISTIMFGLSTLPMLRKAFQTKDLRSYSLGNILLSNGGNIVHSVYVFHLPPGPIWLLHSFYLVSTGLMLIWYLRYEWLPCERGRRSPHELPGVSSLSPDRNPPADLSASVSATAFTPCAISD